MLAKNYWSTDDWFVLYLLGWLRGTLTERWSLTNEVSLCPALDLWLTGDHLCG